MSLIVNSVGDNPQQPGIYAETYMPDQLIAGNLKLVSAPITLASGTLSRGAILGQQTIGAVTTAAKAGGNTGNGSLASISGGVPSQAGVFTLTALKSTLFQVTDPAGNRLPDATVDTAYVNPQISFTIKSLKSTASSAAGGANVGNPTFGTITVAYPALVGAYKLTMTSATAFAVTDPNTAAVGNGTLGVAFAAGGLGFTLTAGGTACVAGDYFTLTTAAAALAATATAAPVATNSAGNGTFGTINAASPAIVGVYKMVFTAAVDFFLEDPTGLIIGHGAAGAAVNAGGLSFTFTAGGTAQVAGDEFTITTTSTGTPFAVADAFTLNVAAAGGSYVLSVRTATDGSQNPCGVLADYADASGGAVSTGAYLLGEFNQNYISYDSSWSIPQLTSALRPLSIFLKTSVSAADPS